MAQVVAVDDAAWTSPWREHAVGAKVFLSFSLILTALLSPAWPGCVLVAAAALGLILGSARIRPGLAALVVLPPIAFIAVGVLPIAVRVGGSPWLAVAPDGGAHAISVAAHGIAGSLALLLLPLTTPMIDLVGWLRRWRIPAAIGEIAELMYRLVFVFVSTAVAIQAAQAARLGGAASFRRRLHLAADAIGTVMVRTWNHSTCLQRGLELRGYEDRLPTLTRTATWRAWWLPASALLVGLITVANVVVA